MIELVLSEDKKGLFVRFTPKYPLSSTSRIDFYRESPSVIEAALLKEHLETALCDLINKIRRVSYLRGWRHAKSKKCKADCFSSHISVSDWENKDAGL